MRPVLVIDDNLDARTVACRILRLLGEETVSVASGAEGLEFLRHRRPRLVLLDLDMPTMDGCAVIRCIRNDPSLVGLPIVMFSGATEKQLAEALNCGADAYLRKGACSIDDIRRSVRQWEESDVPPARTDLN